MYTLGIPNRQYRRATQVLGHEASDPINYSATKQDDGFYMFRFPGADEIDFKNISLLLKQNGITLIGADTQLTERKIMKLTDLIKEAPNLNEMEYNPVIDSLKRIITSWKSKRYTDDRTKWEHFLLDIEELIEDFEEEAMLDAPSMTDLPPGPQGGERMSSKITEPLAEQKLRRLIRKTIRQ
mgnify:CR=1 FL=1